MKKTNMPKVIVIGLDGTGFELLDPWLKQGLLPNIQKIISKGIRGDLQVCLPPVTCPDWKCYSTGKNPAKLGLFWWRQISIKDKKEFTAHNRFNDQKEIWDYLSDAGKKVAVINMPTTYPPKKVNGIFVSGGAGVLGKEYTYPAELRKKLENKYKYRLGAEKVSILSYTPEEITKDCLDVIDKKFAFFKDVLKDGDFDFINFSIFHINTFHHVFWNAEPTKIAWLRIDAHIGDVLKLIEQKDDNYYLFFMSDHGSNEIKEVFNISTWLQKEGYFKLKQKAMLSLMKTFKFDLHNILKITSKIGLSKHNILKILPKPFVEKIAEKLPIEHGEIKSRTGIIDWNNSLAIAVGQGPIYINAEKNSEQYNKIKKELKEKLISLRTPENRPIAIHIYEKEELYKGPYLDEAPDLIIDQAKKIHIKGSIRLNDKIFEKPKHWKGENKKLGLFIASGPELQESKAIKNVKILDLAPTILHILGIEIPSDMDGKVLLPLFNKNSEISQKPVKIQKRINDKSKIKLFTDKIRI